MKKLKAIIGVLASSLMLGAAVGISTIHNNQEAQPVKAATYKTFFIDVTGCTGWDSESLCIHTWNGSSDVYVEATKDAEDYWHVRIDTTGCSGYRWYRCAKGNTGTRWNESGWNSTISNNYCAIKGWDSNASFSGSTSGCEETYELLSTTPSSSTKRVWINPKDNFYDSSARAGLRVFNGSGHEVTYILGGSSQYVNMTHESKTQYFFYADIPTGSDCQLVRLHNVFNFVWTYSGNISAVSGYNTTKIVFSWNAAADLSAGYIDSNNNWTVEYAKKLLDGYSTCVNSADNGYKAYTNLNTNILSKLGTTKLNTLRAETFSAGTYGTRTYGQKIDLMDALNSGTRSMSSVMAELFGFGSDSTQSNNTLIIIIVSLVSVTAIGGYFFLRKRKQER